MEFRLQFFKGRTISEKFFHIFETCFYDIYKINYFDKRKRFLIKTEICMWPSRKNPCLTSHPPPPPFLDPPNLTSLVKMVQFFKQTPSFPLYGGTTCKTRSPSIICFFRYDHSIRNKQ